jgi:hypothetical protein
MTARTTLALAAVSLAVALVVWLGTAPGTPDPSAGSTRAGPTADLAPDSPAVLPDVLAAEPQPLEPAAPAAAPAAETGFVVAVVASRVLPRGAQASPEATALELGVSSSRKALGEALLRFETAPDGKAQVPFPRRLVPAAPDGKAQWLWLRSRGPGLLERVDLERVPQADDTTVTMSVVVQPGTVVEGRILGPDGQPAAGRVDWWVFGDEGITSGTVGLAGPDGLFRGELLHAGRHGLLAAGSSRTDAERSSFFMPEQLDLGTGFSDLFDVDFRTPVPFIEVRVSGPGRIRGRVLDGSGAPAAGVPLVAVLAELDDEAGSLRLPYPRARDLERLGGGHLWVRATTDPDGAFAIAGLRHGLFHVRAADGSESFSGYPILLTPGPVASDGVPLELRLDRPHLAIHVRQADGSLPAGAIGIHRDSRWGFQTDPWPEEPELLVTLSPRDAHLGGWSGAYLEASAIAPGEFVAELDEDLRVATTLELDVGVLGGELPWRPRRVSVPPGSGRVDVEVVLPPAAPRGALVLDVVDASGAALIEQVRVRIDDPATGVVLVDVPCDYTDEEDWPMRIPLPEGGYRLLVEGHPWIDDHHGTLMRRRAHGAHEQPLLIAAGVESRVTARLGEAARLALRVVGAATEADREAIRAQYDGKADDAFVDHWARFVRLRLEREGRWPESPQFARFAMEGTSAAGTHVFPSVAFGSDETSEPLTPGTYRLVATTAGGRELERDVTLVPGHTLSLTLGFE